MLVSDATAGLVTFARLSWSEAPEPTLLILLTALGTSILTLAGAILPAGRFRRRRRELRAGDASAPASVPVAPDATLLRAAARLVAAITLVFLVAFSFGLAQLAILHDDRFALGVPLWFRGVLWLPVALSGAWLWLVFGLWSTRGTRIRRGSRVGNVWLAAVTLATLVVLVHWNLFGAHL